MAEAQSSQPGKQPAKSKRKLEGRPPPDRTWVSTELLHASRDKDGNILFASEQ